MIYYAECKECEWKSRHLTSEKKAERAAQKHYENTLRDDAATARTILVPGAPVQHEPRGHDIEIIAATLTKVGGLAPML